MFYLLLYEVQLHLLSSPHNLREAKSPPTIQREGGGMESITTTSKKVWYSLFVLVPGKQGRDVFTIHVLHANNTIALYWQHYIV